MSANRFTKRGYIRREVLPLLEDVPPSQLREDEQFQDVSFLAGETGDIISRPESPLPALAPFLLAAAALLKAGGHELVDRAVSAAPELGQHVEPVRVSAHRSATTRRVEPRYDDIEREMLANPNYG